jgi:flagellar hook-basal body complex protein FliE
MRVAGVTDTAPLLPSEAMPRAAEGAEAQATGETSFGDVFAGLVDQANHMDHAATAKVEALAAGASDDLHGTMIAAKEADISIKLVGTIRNKVLDAFTEIWKTSV